MSYIEFRNILKKFDNHTVLNNISLNVEEGQLVTLLGPSGCGKSTLLRCLSGLEQVTEGQIFLNGEDITYTQPKDRNIGMVFQQYSLFPNMNVYDNVAFGLKLKKMDKELIDKKVKNSLAMVDLLGREKTFPHELSGGQQQRVALARSIVNEPKVLLLDEPLSAIDAKLRKSLQQQIRTIQQEMKITTLFVTHDQDEAMIMSDVVHLFYNGHVEQSGSPMEIYTKPKTSFAASFIGNYNILNREDFGIITQDFGKEVKEIAIRPETVELANDFTLDNEAHQFEAKVIEYSNRGSVIRYSILYKDLILKSDRLFRSNQLHNIGDKVFVTIKKHNCIYL